MSDNIFDTIVVGGGPAGLSAALYAARQRLRTLLITKDVGGQMTLAQKIENYPGAPFISGIELAQTMLEQAQKFGAEVLYDEVTRVEEADGGFQVHTRGGGTYRSQTLILAFGKTPREIGVPGEQRLTGRGVSYCAICDAPLYRGKRVLIVGWGEPAFEAADLLCRYQNKVYIVHRGRGQAGELRERCDVEVIPQSEVAEIKGGIKVESVVLKNLATGETRELEVDAVFVELGYVAKTEWVKDFVKLNEQGEIIVDNLCRTSRPGVYAAGDVTNIPYKQAVIAAAQGTIAALEAYNYIQQKKGKPTIKSDWRELQK